MLSSVSVSYLMQVYVCCFNVHLVSFDRFCRTPLHTAHPLLWKQNQGSEKSQILVFWATSFQSRETREWSEWWSFLLRQSWPKSGTYRLYGTVCDRRMSALIGSSSHSEVNPPMKSRHWWWWRWLMTKKDQKTTVRSQTKGRDGDRETRAAVWW